MTLHHSGSFPGSRGVGPCKIIFVSAPVDTSGLVPTGSLISVRKKTNSRGTADSIMQNPALAGGG